MAAAETYNYWEEDAARRLLIPLDSESRQMLDELVTHFYPNASGLQKTKHRGLITEMAIRALYQRTAPKTRKES